MPKVPGLFSRRGGGWTFRVRVPDHLRDAIGKREIWKSLGTVPYAEAARLARIERVNADRLFVETETRLQTGTLDELSDARMYHLVRSFFFSLEQEAVAQPADQDGRAHLLDIVRGDLAGAGQSAHDPAVQQVARHVIEKAKLRRAPEPKSFLRLCELVREALIEHYQREETRLRQVPERRTNRLFADIDRFHPPKAHLALAEAVRRYEEDPQRLSVAEKTKAAWKFRFGAWLDLLGPDRAVSDITRADLRDALDTLMRVPTNAAKHFPGMPLRKAVEAGHKAKLPRLSAKSVQLYIDCLNALFRYLVQEELVSKNPVMGLKGPKIKDDEKRRPWTIEELSGFFRASPYDAPWRAGREASWLFWLPLLGLFSGACQGEFAGW